MRRYLKFEFEHTEDKSEEAGQPTEQPETVEETTMWVTTSSGGLNMRKFPQEDAAVVITIPKHAQVTAMGAKDDWRYVSFKGYMGYVKSKFLSTSKPSEESDIPEQQDMYITVDGLVLDITLELPGRTAFATTVKQTSMYTMCAKNGQTVAALDAGEEVEVLMIGEIWCKVDYQGVQGYCLREQLNVRYE